MTKRRGGARAPFGAAMTVAVAVVVVAVAVGAASCTAGDGGDRATATTTPTVSGPSIRIQAPERGESATVAEVYGQYLRARGYSVEVVAPARSRTEGLAALGRGEVGLVVDAIAEDVGVLVPDARVTAEPDQVITVLKPALAAMGATVLDYSPAATGDAFVVRDDSPASKISNVKNLDYVLGLPPECERRRRCYGGLIDPEVYGIEFNDFTRIELGPQLGDALAAKDVDAVVWTSTAPEIAERGFKILEDDKRLFPAQNLAPILSTSVSSAYGARLADDLNRLSQTITTDDVVAWNVSTDLRGEAPAQVAADWLEKKGLA